ncbi:DUF3422 family protein [Insolitispirillum peregrinum]|uniref:Uncharacterized membrane-anchored protein n=1 Tax=Insolitispirillum peregrinum TaxID=80876 RepID=A0A1N7MTS6_9PROT|nr:DUF3422 domain-containing protein [Insolitispirillum peregrinum]SIS89537.1 Uncharacterized membrane-anchored protein [Insolitispirillum peregrinum]
MIDLVATEIVRDGVPARDGTGRRAILREHPLRLALANEVHARPYEILEAPVRVTHLAIMAGEHGYDAERAHLLDLCDRFGVSPPEPEAIYYAATLWPEQVGSTTNGGLRLRWERHTEFCTYTFYRFDAFGHSDPFGGTALDLVPDEWLADMPGEMMVALHAAICEGADTHDLTHIFGDHLVVGSSIAEGAGTAWSDFRLHNDGFGRILINADSLTRGQIGRMVQRLLELETYRMMALLAFPIARSMGPKLSRLEREVATIIGAMADSERERVVGRDPERLLLDRLIDVAAETEQLVADNSYRFGAAKAYQALVNRCVQEMREERLPGSQTFREFMDRRFAPAMRTCEAMAERADALGRRVARASDMLRTRVDISLEENNRDLLHSMNRRADAQLRLQETVEGLSVVAISYYLWSLIAYLLKGAKAAGLPVNPDIAALVAVPLVLGMVFIGVKRLKAALVGDEHGGH